MQIWPAIDIRGGKCVRLIQGDYAQERVYGEDPADMAARWVADGAECLHLVDLDGAREGVSVNEDAIAEILRNVSVPCELGGGIRDESTIDRYIEMGLSRLVIGTRANADPEWFRQMCEKYPGKMVVGIDAREGHVATNGWLETSETEPITLAKRFSECAIGGLIYTDISKDGMLSGPNFDAMREMNEAVDLPIVASGGVTTTDDITRLAGLGLSGCIIGRSLYEGRLTLKEALLAAKSSVA